GDGEVVEVVCHALRHASEEVEFFVLKDLVLKRNLIDYKCYICRKFTKELDVCPRERLAARLFFDDQKPQGMPIHEEGEGEDSGNRLEFLPRSIFERLVGLDIGRTQREI